MWSKWSRRRAQCGRKKQTPHSSAIIEHRRRPSEWSGPGKVSLLSAPLGILISLTLTIGDDRGPQHFRLLLAGVRESREGFQVRLPKQCCVGIVGFPFLLFSSESSQISKASLEAQKTFAVLAFSTRKRSQA